jgi:hypothetical protein
MNKLFLNILGLLVVLVFGLGVLYCYWKLGNHFQTMVKLFFVQVGVIGGGLILYVFGQKCISGYKYLRNKCRERRGWWCKRGDVKKEENPFEKAK